MKAQASIDREELLQHRIDALRRQAQSPGQLGLDLGGNLPAAGQSTGEPCGQSWISRNNVFRAVRIRRERLQSPRADSILKSLFRGNGLQQRIDALRARWGPLNG